MKEIFWSPYFKIMRESKTCQNYTEVGRLSARLYAMLDGISDATVFSYADKVIEATVKLQREAVLGNVGVELYKEGSIEVKAFNVLFKIIEAHLDKPVEDKEWDELAKKLANLPRYKDEKVVNDYIINFSVATFGFLEKLDKQLRKEAIA